MTPLDDQVATLRALLRLRNEVDDLLESHQHNRASLAEVMRTLLPLVCARLGARGAFVRTYDDDLRLSVYRHPSDLDVPRWSEVLEACSSHRKERFVQPVRETDRPLPLGSPDSTPPRTADEWLLVLPLDVGGAWFGFAGVLVSPAPPEIDPASHREHQLTLLQMACEELDDYLMSIYTARERHQLFMKLGDALRHPVLTDGLVEAVAALTEATPLDNLLLVYHADLSEPMAPGEGMPRRTSPVQVQLFEHGKLIIDTMAGFCTEATTLDELRRLGIAYLDSDDRTLLGQLGFEKAREEVLISGITQTATIGKLLATSRHGGFNTTDRELLGGFAGFIRQRVVDFNKEWRRLASSFRPEDVARLLREADYESRFLSPRDEVVAIGYADIAGFTRISEQILRSPSAVGSLVEAWSAEAVRLVWKHGGVFDKMVGDCIIALFGPPFYDGTPGQRLAAALRWADELRAATRAFPDRPEFSALRQEGLAVTTSVHLTPLFVGAFGPNGNFTGFSSGMNNTARLQGLARRDEILVMAEAIEALPPDHGFVFGELRSAQVKNVAEAIHFRALLGV